MAKLNIAALKEIQEDLNSRTSKGDGLFLYANKLTAESDVRLLPPPDSIVDALGGTYFKEQVVFWINNKPYTSPQSMDKDCPMQDEFEKATELAKTDKTIKALLADSKKFKKQNRFLLPILQLECKFDNNNVAAEVKVKDNAPKVLVANSTLLKAINKLVTGRQFQNGTDYGIMDRVKGHNLILSRTGKDLDTVYGAEAWTTPFEMDAKYYDKVPNVLELTEKDIKSNAYLRGVVRNYFYGEPMPKDDVQDDAVATKEQPKAEVSTGRTRTATVVEETVEEPKNTSRTATAKTTTSRNLMDDLKNLNDDDN